MTEPTTVVYVGQRSSLNAQLIMRYLSSRNDLAAHLALLNRHLSAMACIEQTALHAKEDRPRARVQLLLLLRSVARARARQGRD